MNSSLLSTGLLSEMNSLDLSLCPKQIYCRVRTLHTSLNNITNKCIASFPTFLSSLKCSKDNRWNYKR